LKEDFEVSAFLAPFFAQFFEVGTPPGFSVLINAVIPPVQPRARPPPVPPSPSWVVDGCFVILLSSIAVFLNCGPVLRQDAVPTRCPSLSVWRPIRSPDFISILMTYDRIFHLCFPPQVQWRRRLLAAPDALMTGPLIDHCSIFSSQCSSLFVFFFVFFLGVLQLVIPASYPMRVLYRKTESRLPGLNLPLPSPVSLSAHLPA